MRERDGMSKCDTLSCGPFVLFGLYCGEDVLLPLSFYLGLKG